MIAVLIIAFIMVFLVYIGMPWLAVVVGLAGILAATGSKKTTDKKEKRFEDVPVPDAEGGYPGWDFWKSLLEKTGENLWELVRTFTGVHYGIDAWSEGVREKVWQQDKPSHEYLPAGVYPVHKKFAPEMVRVQHMLGFLRVLESRIRAIEKELKRNPPPNLRDALIKELNDLKKERNELVKQINKLLKKGL